MSTTPNHSSEIGSAITPSWAWLWQKPVRALAFGFGSGLSPSAPGTVGTLWAWAIALLFQFVWNEPSANFVSTSIFFGFLLGIIACGITGNDLGQPDHGGMVWDEVIAFWIILAFVLPTSLINQFLAFVLFRYFDAVKPGPIGMIDDWFKHWEPSTRLSNWQITGIRGFGVMIDDLAAALATLLVFAIGIRLFG